MFFSCRCSSADVEQWRWYQRYLYQAQSQTASCRCSPSSRCPSLAPVPTASWFNLWAWDYDSGLHPCSSRGSSWSCPTSVLGSHCCWKQPPPVVLSVQLHPHQQLSGSQLWCLVGQQPCKISSCWALCGSRQQTHRGRGGAKIGATSWSSLLGHPYSSLTSLAYPSLHLVFISVCKLTSIIACTVLTNDVLVCVVHLLGDTKKK